MLNGSSVISANPNLGQVAFLFLLSFYVERVPVSLVCEQEPKEQSLVQMRTPDFRKTCNIHIILNSNCPES